MNDWRPVPGVPGAKVKMLGNGQMHYKRTGSVRKTAERNHTLQEVAKRQPSIMDTGSMRMIASYPEDVDLEMREQAGTDPDSQKAWLRDHPMYTTVRSSQVGPAKKITIAPGSPLYQREYERVFGPRSEILCET